MHLSSRHIRLLAIPLALGLIIARAHAGTLAGYYYSLAENDPDVANNQGNGALVTTVGAGLGPDGLPIVNTASPQGAQLHDVNSVTHELEWWSPDLDANVSVLNNPVYPSQIMLPFVDNNVRGQQYVHQHHDSRRERR